MGVINVNVQSRDEEDLTLALKLLCRQHKKTAGFRVDTERNELHLYWTNRENTEGYSPFPMAMENGSLLAKIIIGWLGEVKYPREPNHDGSNAKGWHFFSGDWITKGDPYVSAVVCPAWIEYHK